MISQVWLWINCTWRESPDLPHAQGVTDSRQILEHMKPEVEEKEAAPAAGSTKPRVLADGTYATETAFTSVNNARLEAVKAAAKPPLRSSPIPYRARLCYSDGYF